MSGHDFTTLASRSIINVRVWKEVDEQNERDYGLETLLSDDALVRQAAAIFRRLEQNEKERRR